MSKSRKARREAAKKRQQRQAMLKWLIPAIIVAVIAMAGIVYVATQGSDDDNGSGESVASRILISPDEYVEQFGDTEHFLLDVRTADEFAARRIAGAYNISHTEVGNRLDEIPTDVPIVLYCRTGNRSVLAADVLLQAGYSNVYDIDGGIVNWEQQYEVER